MKTLYIKEFSRYPGPRYESLGENSGEKFREFYLVPAILENDEICVDFDGVFGYGSSFFEEAFGGLVRKGISKDKINNLKKNLKSKDPALVAEVVTYINDALRDAK